MYELETKDNAAKRFSDTPVVLTVNSNQNNETSSKAHLCSVLACSPHVRLRRVDRGRAVVAGCLNECMMES